MQTYPCSVDNPEQKGFTLVELLVALAMTGFVVVAMYSVFTTMQKTTVQEGDVVEMQQQLRATLDMLGRDIVMAGVMSGDSAVDGTSTNQKLVLNTSSTRYIYGIITADKQISSSEETVTLRTPDLVDSFDNGDTLGIFRPMNEEHVGPDELTVTAKDRNAKTLTLDGFSGGEIIKAGDLLVRTTSGITAGEAITWELDDLNNPTRLTRTVSSDSGSPQDIIDVSAYQPLVDPARKPLFVTFHYLSAAGEAIPAGSGLGDDNAEDVTAVQATVYLTRKVAQGSGSVKDASRSMSGTFELRNVFE